MRTCVWFWRLLLTSFPLWRSCRAAAPGAVETSGNTEFARSVLCRDSHGTAETDVGCVATAVGVSGGLERGLWGSYRQGRYGSAPCRATDAPCSPRKAVTDPHTYATCISVR